MLEYPVCCYHRDKDYIDTLYSPADQRDKYVPLDYYNTNNIHLNMIWIVNTGIFEW